MSKHVKSNTLCDSIIKVLSRIMKLPAFFLVTFISLRQSITLNKFQELALSFVYR